MQGQELQPPASRTERTDAGNLVLIEGIMFQKTPAKGTQAHRLAIPEDLVEELLAMAHDRHGHQGISRTFDEARRYAWCPDLRQKCQKYVRECPQCNERKPDDRAKRQKLSPDQRAPRIGYRIHIDGNHLPRTRNDNECMLVAIDAATKWVTLMACQAETSRATCELLEGIIYTSGPIRELTSDQGSAFMSREVTAFCRGHGIVQKPTSGGHAQSNGQVERVNRTINDIIAKMLGPNTDRWDEHTQEIAWILNTSASEATGYPPYQLVYGREVPSYPFLDFYDPENESPPTDYIKGLQQIVTGMEKASLANQSLAADRQKKQYDKGRRDYEYQVGEKVRWFRSGRPATGISKLAGRWDGPFFINKRKHGNSYLLEDVKGHVIPKTAHARDLKSADGERPISLSYEDEDIITLDEGDL